MSCVGEIRQLAKAQAGATHRKGKSPTKRRRVISAIFHDKRKFVAAKELSVFVDESGSFDADCFPSRFYVVSLVFHDQTIDVSSIISDLEQSLAGSGFPGICIHVGPIIRREDEFRKMEIVVRRRLLYKMTVFARKAPVMCRSFCVDKRYHSTPEAIEQCLERAMSDFMSSNAEDFSCYESVKIYYDNGQSRVLSILRKVFKHLPVEYKENVKPENYRLFQLADLVCSFRLLALKHETGLPLSKSEEYFFFGVRPLYKNFLRPLSRLLK